MGSPKYFIFRLSKKDNRVAYVDLPWEHLGIFSDYYSLVQLVTFCFNRLPKDELKPSWQFLRKHYMMHIFILYLSRRHDLTNGGEARSVSLGGNHGADFADEVRQTCWRFRVIKVLPQLKYTCLLAYPMTLNHSKNIPFIFLQVLHVLAMQTNCISLGKYTNSHENRLTSMPTNTTMVGSLVEAERKPWTFNASTESSNSRLAAGIIQFIVI